MDIEKYIEDIKIKFPKIIDVEVVNKKRLMTPLSHQSSLFHCPVSPTAIISPQFLPIWL